MEKKLIVFNWKENPETERGALRLFAAVGAAARGEKKGKTNIVACPPFVYLKLLSKKLGASKVRLSLGAQDVFWENKGAYTGEIGPAALRDIGKSLRYDVRKLDKSLFGTGRAVIETVPHDMIDHGMNVLFEQHKLRWRKRGLPGAFLGKSIRFHKEWAETASRNGWLRLSVLKLDGEPIGAIYAMALGETTYYYQAGFDPAKGSVSPGTLLVAYTIRRAIEEGASHFDFMRGDEPYKRRWKPNHAYRNLRLIASANGFLGNVGSSWNQAGSRVEGRLRARLEGRGLIG